MSYLVTFSKQFCILKTNGFLFEKRLLISNIEYSFKGTEESEILNIIYGLHI